MAALITRSLSVLTDFFIRVFTEHNWHYLAPVLISIQHVSFAPYTKVEESFNIQAIHDFIRYSTKDLHLFDHVTFPGAVPRSFFGARAMAVLSNLIRNREADGIRLQRQVRGQLGMFSAGALFWSIFSIEKKYGKNVAAWYTFLSASQFHIWFYTTRTLPNTFAFSICALAFTYFLHPTSPGATDLKKKSTQLRRGFFFLAFAAVVFRAEIAILIASQAGYVVLESRSLYLIARSILPGLALGAIVAIVVTVPQDTMLWQREQYFLPELEAFWFNVFPKDHQGASAWGTSPWHWYFTSAIPRLISFPALLLIPYGLFLTTKRREILNALIPSLGYTAIYSILPHKETRFLFPIVPQLTLALAVSASHLYERQNEIAKLFTGLLTLSLVFTGVVSHGILLPLSAQTYPGGNALQELHAYHNSTYEFRGFHHPEVRVHLTNLALQTGVTRFIEQPVSNITKPSKSSSSTTYTLPSWTYDKTPTTNTSTKTFWSQFDYVIVEPGQTQTEPALTKPRWTKILSIPSLRRSSPRLLGPDTARGCLVLQCSQRLQPDDDGLYTLFSAMYGRRIALVYGVVHDVLREGYLTGISFTGGRWVDWGLEERLVVLENQEATKGRKVLGPGPVGGERSKADDDWHGVKPRVDNFM